jgi:hypothetical protein
MSLSREFKFERQTVRETDRVHSISINPPLLPLNLSIDEPSLQQQGGCGGGAAPPHYREAKHLGNRGAVFILATLLPSMLEIKPGMRHTTTVDALK